MSDGVLYWMNGDRHAEHLVISLYSLRRHWPGDVAIISGDDKAHIVADYCANDERLSAGRLRVMTWREMFNEEAPRRSTHGNGAHYLVKTLLPKLSPFDRTVFLDADTVVTGQLDELFPEHGSPIIHLTMFADWKTNEKPVRNRLEQWRPWLPVQVAMMTANSYPAINTGVMAWTSECQQFQQEWSEVTARNVSFMCDELVAQLIFYKYPHNIFSERWNASVVYSVDSAKRRTPAPAPETVRIWHGHGMKFIKREQGRKLWMPLYDECCSQNIADITTWTPLMKKLRQYRAAPERYA